MDESHRHPETYRSTSGRIFRMSQRRPIAKLAPAPLPIRLDQAAGRTLEQLPLPLTSFIGREGEVRAIGSLLDRSDVRLVTLTGPGGVGKSRLALRVAEDWSSAFTDGVAFVPLADVHDPERVAAVVAETLGVFDRIARDPVRAVQDYLASRVFLLILDNFEHLLSTAPLLTQWLSHCRWLTILVTSRFQLRVSGEHEVVVQPLSLPETEIAPSFDRLCGVPSIQLFIERAQAARADFALTPANAGVIVEICTRLEGLPLAIELGAARMSHMGPGALLERLDRGLPVLSDGPQDQPDRLRSLERAIAWSFDLLPSGEQVLLQRLSVFAGGFDLDAAEAVAPTISGTMDGIASLVSKSFLESQEIGGCSRYTMLESIREFAAARLDASAVTPAMRDRHAMYFVELAEREDETIWGGPHHRQALDRLDIDLANLRAALAWLEAKGDGASLLRLAAALGGTWHYRSHWLEGKLWLAKGLLLGGDAVPAARATALVKLSILTRDLGETPDPVWLGEAVQIRRELQDDRGIGRALLLSASLVAPEDIDRKSSLLSEAEVFSTRAENAGGLAWVCFGRASMRRRAGDIAEAYEQMLEAYDWFRKDGFPFGVWFALIELADIEIERGHQGHAAEHFIEMLGLWEETRSKELLVNAVSRIAEFACTNGNPEGAVALLSALDALGQSARLAAAPRDLERATGVRERARARLTDDQFAAAWKRGMNSSVTCLIASSAELLATVCDPIVPAPLEAIGGLTVREIDVIRLLSAGKSNREIANELSIGETTAISHVRNILSKLGYNSRTAAAAWAIRHGFDQPM
jgi:non-specific serine/threonine protein kinase